MPGYDPVLSAPEQGMLRLLDAKDLVPDRVVAAEAEAYTAEVQQARAI